MQTDKMQIAASRSAPGDARAQTLKPDREHKRVIAVLNSLRKK
jgi:hypothetical protein